MAIRLDPADDAAWSIRGSFFRALGNVGWVKRQLAAMLPGAIPQGGFPEAEDSIEDRDPAGAGYHAAPL